MRKIPFELEQFLDQKLANFGAAQEAIRKKDARALMQYAALACVGIREVPTNKGKMVLLFSDTIGPADSIPWCMAFVQSMIAYAEEKTGKVSPVSATEHCMTCWRETPKTSRVKFFPAPGAVIIWKRDGSDSGHTGIVLSATQKSFVAVEGNTGGGLDENAESIREGDGVYKTRRPMGDIGSLELIGFIKPF